MVPGPLLLPVVFETYVEGELSFDVLTEKLMHGFPEPELMPIRGTKGLLGLTAFEGGPAVSGEIAKRTLVRGEAVQLACPQKLFAVVVDGEPWLALDDVRLQALDEDGQRLRCRLQVASVSVDVEAETPGEGAL